jgi:hypothetical protein
MILLFDHYVLGSPGKSRKILFFLGGVKIVCPLAVISLVSTLAKQKRRAVLNGPPL